MKKLPNKQDRAGISISNENMSAEFMNSIASEVENIVTTTGQSLDTGAEDSPDQNTTQVSRGVTAIAQVGQSCSDSGTTNSYILNNKSTINPSSVLLDGMRLVFVPGNDNTGNSTLNYNGLGSRKILLQDGSEIPSGTLKNTERAEVFYESSADSGSGAWIIPSWLISNVEAATESEVRDGVISNKYVSPNTLKKVLDHATIIRGATTGAPNEIQDSNLGDATGTVSSDARYVLANPFGINTPVEVEAEILLNSVWSGTGWQTNVTNGDGIGTRASYVEGVGIVVQTGGGGVASSSRNTGGGHGYVGAFVASARCRVTVRRVRN